MASPDKTPSWKVHRTTDDRREAHAIAKQLREDGYRAVVMEVVRMLDPPRTANRYAVVVEVG